MGIIEKMRLDGKKGFVTGAARGIGKCTATAFAEAGADVAIVDLDIEEAKKTAKELAEKTGRKVIAIQTDCTDKEQVDAMVKQVVEEFFGVLDCRNRIIERNLNLLVRVVIKNFCLLASFRNGMPVSLQQFSIETVFLHLLRVF